MLFVWLTLCLTKFLACIDCLQLTYPPNTNICVYDKTHLGHCVQIESCQFFQSLIQNNRDLAVLILRESSCGFRGSTPIVCCPFKQSQSPESQPVEDKPKVLRSSVLVNPDIYNDCGILSAKLRIFGGDEATVGSWPWIVALGYSENRRFFWGCSGVLISPQYVLTAAHCLIKEDNDFRHITVVRLGDYNLDSPVDNDNVIDLEPMNIIIHENYSGQPQFYADIGIIKLNTTVQNTGMHIKSSTLRQVTIPVIEQEKCRELYRRHKINITDEHFCAYDHQKNICQGDSGGPLIIHDSSRDQYELLGISSLGGNICGGKLPGVYTKVPSFLDWILRQIPELAACGSNTICHV